MPTIALEDTEKLRAFEQRMQDEGAAAFGAGPAPWEDWDDVGTLGTYQVWNDPVRHAVPEREHGIPMTSRLLTGLAQLAVLTLLVGTAGVYFSIQTPEQVASSGIQPPPIVVAGRTGLRPVTGALPVLRTGPDTLAQTPPDTDAAQTGDRLDDTTLAGAVIPPELEQVPATPPETPAVTAEQPLALALEELPGTAAGPATATPSPATPATVNPDMRTGQDSPAVETPPRQIAMQTEAVEFLPDNPTRTPAPAQAARELANTWVINLASYNFESMAKRKLATFHNKGVNAELVRITVKGKPMIRIRTTGYTSAREARDWVALLEERLGLQGAWVAKYQPGEE